MPPTPSNQSSFSWQQRFDLVRRMGAHAVQVESVDAVLICRSVSSTFYTYAPWSFTLLTSDPGSIPCLNLQQDYAGPNDMYRLTRAWLYVPTVGASGGVSPNVSSAYGNTASGAAQAAAAASAAFVAAQAQGGGTPAALIWPPDGLNVVKRLPVNLVPYSYTSQRSVCQLPNSQTLRLSGATAVASTLPYELQIEYQPLLTPMTNLGLPCWFPDDYASVADELLLYWLYKFSNDPRAGAASHSGSQYSYSGQLAVAMGALDAAASAEREGSVDTFLPQDSLGADYGSSLWFV